MNSSVYQGPDVLHICERCGCLASGECDVCRRAIALYAPMAAEAMLGAGLKEPRFAPAVTIDAWERKWRDAVTEEFHRQRAARMYGDMPRVEGEAPTGSCRAWGLAAIVGTSAVTLAMAWLLVELLRGAL
jgi:hypothetical protein